MVVASRSGAKLNMNIAALKEKLAADGFREIDVLEWEADRFNETHSHPYTARAYILSGTLTVDCGTEATTCGKGDEFTLAANIPHTERAGPEGVKFVFGIKP